MQENNIQSNIRSQVVELYVDDIIPNRFQPREVFDDKALQELAASIKEHGVIQPIIVRKLGDKYEIIAGERRYKATIIAGFTKIPAIIRNLDDKETAKVALLENLQRKDLSPIEEARTYQKILDLDSMTQEELGKTMGKSQAAVANKLRLLQLSDEVQEALLNNQISERHARSLLSVSDKEKQVELLHQIINEKLTVRDLDNRLKNMGYISSNNVNDRNITAGMDVNLDALKSQAEDIKPETLPTNNLNELLQGTKQEVIDPSEIGPKFKFLDDFEKQSNSTTVPNKESKTYSAPNVEPASSIEPPTVVSPTSDNSSVQLVPGLTVETTKSNQNTQLSTDIPGLNSSKIKPNQQWTTPSGNEELPIPQFNQKKEELHYSIRDAINAFRDLTDELVKNGVKIDIEEVDLENTYQINIQIDKKN